MRLLVTTAISEVWVVLLKVHVGKYFLWAVSVSAVLHSALVFHSVIDGLAD